MEKPIVGLFYLRPKNRAKSSLIPTLLMRFQTCIIQSQPCINENRPFVGINFVATGDFNQIKPVNATSLASAMIQHCISENMGGKTGVKSHSKNLIKVLQAANMFKQFKTLFLTEQIRASGDKKHTVRTIYLSSFSFSFYMLQN